MKITCPVSGVSYTTSSGYGTVSYAHPALNTPLKKLVQQLVDWHAARITEPDDQYLYLLAWATNLPELQITTQLDSSTTFPVLLAHSEQLFKTVLACAKFPHVKFPAMVVRKPTDLAQSLTNWLSVLAEAFHQSNQFASQRLYNDEVRRLESVLDNITSKQLKGHLHRTSKVIAAWADKAGRFPHTNIVTPQNTTVPLNEYWIQIIIHAFNESTLDLIKSGIGVGDVAELIEHCEDELPHGSTYAFTLMRKLRAAKATLIELSGIPDIGPADTIVADTLPMDVPIEPERKQYKSSVDYLKARLAWQKAILHNRAVANNKMSIEEAL